MRPSPGAVTHAPYLRLLGPPLVVWNGAEETMGDALPQRMLAYLALSGEWVSREQVAELLWPDADPPRRFTNLRRVLGRLKGLPWAAGVGHDRGRLRWLVESDVASFADPRLATAERILLWRGPLLDGMHADEETPFGRWLSAERHRAQARWRALALQRAEEAMGAGDGAGAEEAIGLLASLLERDALDEEILQRLLSAYGRAGRTAQGLDAYRRFQETLKRELGLTPLESTQQLAVDLGRLEPSRSGAERFEQAGSPAVREPSSTEPSPLLRGGDALASMGSAARRMLEAASLAAAPFTLEQIAPATALSEWLALDALEQAVQAGLLAEEKAGTFRFSSEAIRHAVAEGVDPRRRALIEQRLAWVLRRQGASPALVAGHFEQAGRRAEALHWHRRAAAEALRLHLPAAALEHLEHAAELADEDVDRVEIALQRAELHDDTVDPHGRERALQEAADAVERLADPAWVVRVALARANHEAERGRADEAAAEVQKAMAAGARGEAFAQARFVTARLHLWTGSLAASEAALIEAMTELPKGPSALRGSLHMGFFKVAAMRGELPVAGSHLGEAIVVFETLGRRDLLADALCMRGVLLMAVGDRAGAIEALEQGLGLAREMGLVHVQRSAILNLVKVHTDVADVAAAAPLIDEGLALAHDFETVDAETAFLLSVGYVRYLQGDLAAAWRAWDRARDVADAHGNLLARISTRTAPFYPYLRSGDLARCRQLLDEVRPLVEAHGRSGVEPRLDIYAARLALAEGRPELVAAALEALREREGLPDEERSEIALALALARSASGDDHAALEALQLCQDAPTFEVALHALALRLHALVRSGRPWAEVADEARAHLAGGRVTPFEAIDLTLALAGAHEASGEQEEAAALRGQALARSERLQRSVGNEERGF